MVSKEVAHQLQSPFPSKEIEWRVQSCGISNNKPWVMVLAYVQARAIQRRLDSVFGWDGWADEYRAIDNNMICRLGVRTDNGWIYKENGASETQVEAFKGGISSAFKRVASSGFGIGRYLYDLEESFAECQTDKPNNMKGWEKAKTKDKKTIYWKIPSLPSWALQNGKVDNMTDYIDSQEEVEDKDIKGISETKIKSLEALCKRKDVSVSYVCKFYKRKSLSEFSDEEFVKLTAYLNKKPDKQ